MLQALKRRMPLDDSNCIPAFPYLGPETYIPSTGVPFTVLRT